MNITQLGPLEREILQIVWDKHPVSVNKVRAMLISHSQRKLAYTTVMTILSRLTDKQVLTRIKESRTYLYSPAEPKPQFLKSLVKATLNSMVDRYGQEALAAFVEETATFSRTERQTMAKKLSASKPKSK